ncbi:MAG TPA: NUDIX domain-containing protein [Alphaproteobacteria bacterium]
MTETPSPSKKYVLGFAFSEDKSKLVLIRKNRPEWQKGKLNGVGGKIEDYDADAYAAMCREFKEEAGIETTAQDWNHYVTLNGDYGFVIIFCAFSDRFMQARTQSDEAVEIIDLDDRAVRTGFVSNLGWLIEIALDENQSEFFVHVDYRKDFAAARGV